MCQSSGEVAANQFPMKRFTEGSVLFSIVQKILRKVLGIEGELDRLRCQHEKDSEKIMCLLREQRYEIHQIYLAVEPKPATTIVLSLGTPEPQ